MGSDSGVFANCRLYSQLEQKTVPLPCPQPLPGRKIPVPYCIVDDGTISMKSYIFKTIPILSRACWTVENSFEILANRFLVLRKPVLLNSKITIAVVLTICAPHNFLVDQNEQGYLGNCMNDAEISAPAIFIFSSSWEICKKNYMISSCV